VMRYGHVGKGAQRWIEAGGLQLQPSELMKIALVLALASWFHRASWERIGNPLFLIPPVLAVLAPVGLIVLEPNLGTAVITALLGAAMLFAAGVRWWKFILVALPVPFAARLAYGHLHDYQRARIDTFLHPESDPLLGEEFGFMGGVAVMALLGLIVLGGMAIALRCRHQFGRLVAFGIAMNFFLYVFVNIAMVMGAIPVGGVPLPLISHGGSAMITVMVGFGVLMSVHVHRDVAFGEARDAT